MKHLLTASLAALTLIFAQGDNKPALKLVEVGQPVPAFRLNDHLGNAVTIAPGTPTEESTWTVLAFYPKAATPG